MPQDLSTCREWWEQYAPQLKDALHLHTWHLTVEWGHITDKVKGRCSPDPCYHRVTIEIDPELVDDEADFLHTLRHELLHVFHAEMQLLRRQWELMLTECSSAVLLEALEHAIERLVYRMERMFDLGLKMTTQQMMERASE